MLKNAKEFRNYSLRATDGEIGRLKDFYFDDRRWTVRYLVVETGAWLESRRVLISPEAIRSGPEWGEQVLPLDLSQEEIRRSPSVDMARPITQQAEEDLRQYYGWPSYFDVLPLTAPPPAIPPGAEKRQPADPHLYSSSVVLGYHLEALDGPIGHVADFLIDDSTWDIAYVVIDTRNWLPGRHVLLDPEWIGQVDWAGARLRVNLARDVIKASPPYDASRPASTEYSARLYSHYGKSSNRRATV